MRGTSILDNSLVIKLSVILREATFPFLVIADIVGCQPFHLFPSLDNRIGKLELVQTCIKTSMSSSFEGANSFSQIRTASAMTFYRSCLHFDGVSPLNDGIAEYLPAQKRLRPCSETLKFIQFGAPPKYLLPNFHRPFRD